jgi:hypothetical protein
MELMARGWAICAVRLCVVVSTVGLLVMSESAPWDFSGRLPRRRESTKAVELSRGLYKLPGKGFFSNPIVAEPIPVD